MRDYYEREALRGFGEELRRKEERRNKSIKRGFYTITAVGFTLVCLLAIKMYLEQPTVGYTVVNPSYINEYMTPNTPETIVIVGMSREALLQNGYTIIDGPDVDVDDSKTSSKKGYWVKNPDFISFDLTPDEYPSIWVEE